MHFFEEIKDYIDFGEFDEACLRRLGPMLEPEFDAIAQHFYDSLDANPRTRDVFEGPEQLARLQRTLRVWLSEVFEGPWDHDYYLKRQRIGKVHVRVGLLPHFMFGAMNLIRRDLLARVHELDLDDELRCLEAVEKILDIELTIMLQSYWNSMMEQKLKVPAALATGMAHEIRNPLNTIGLQLTVLRRRIGDIAPVIEPDANARIGQILDALEVELQRIRGLTSEMMDFAKPIDLNPAWHDATMLLDEVVHVHGPTLDASNIELEVIHQGPEPVWVDGDRLRQILVNLLTNAVEALDDGGKVILRILNSHYGTTIEVEDTGPGMEPAMKYRVFDLFFTTKASGTGLGLPIVRKIVEGHGGTIDVLSKPGRGTKFTMKLPRPPRADEAATAR